MKPTTSTVARTVILAIALLNQIFAIVGIPALDIDEATIYELCSLIFTIATAVTTWWKNNSFTEPAIVGDDAKEEEKLKANL
jgi:SPP1 family holin